MKIKLREFPVKITKTEANTFPFGGASKTCRTYKPKNLVENWSVPAGVNTVKSDRSVKLALRSRKLIKNFCNKR